MLNSCHPLVCAPSTRLRAQRASLFRSYGGKLPSSFSVILSSALVCSTSPPVSVSGTDECGGYFLELLGCPEKSNNPEQRPQSVTIHWPTNINVVPIDYAFRPHLRERLTLRRLTLRRNPWTFGDNDSHIVSRYLSRHPRFLALQHSLRYAFTALRTLSYPTKDPGGSDADVISVVCLSPVSFSAQTR